jgi:biopolymer transport protein ExbD
VLKENDMINLFLEADRETSHGRVVKIMDLAKRAGIPTIIIAAQWDPKG